MADVYETKNGSLVVLGKINAVSAVFETWQQRDSYEFIIYMEAGTKITVQDINQASVVSQRYDLIRRLKSY